MAALTTLADALARQRNEKRVTAMFHTMNAASVQNPNAGSGYFSFIPCALVASTPPTTLLGYETLYANVSADLFLTQIESIVTGSYPSVFAWYYKLGTLALTATGDQFTHAAGVTFPLTRTIMGQTTPVPLLPMLYVTTATLTTAPVVRLRTAAAGAGYVNHAGVPVVGTKTITFPTVPSAVQSSWVFKLEDGDAGVLDVSAIEVVTASAAGACDVYGVEAYPLGPALYAQSQQEQDYLALLARLPLRPAVATGGTVASFLAIGAASGGFSASGSLVAVVNA